MSRTITITSAMFEALRIKLSYDLKGGEALDWPCGLTAADVAGMGIAYDEEEDGLEIGEGRWHYDYEYAPPGGICRSCWDTGIPQKRYRFVDADDEIITVSLSDVEYCPACIARADAEAVLPPLYRRFHFTTLKPFPGIDLPLKHQQTLIDQVVGKDPETDLAGHSVHFAGPARQGKSVLASALLSRMFDRYAELGWYEDFRFDRRMPIYRIAADKWSTQMTEYEYRDYETEREMQPPQPNVNTILSLSNKDYPVEDRESWLLPQKTNLTKYPPIIVLEEIDKFAATETKVKRLNLLLSEVFDHGGMIISTSNLTRQQFSDRFDDYFRRRLTESTKDGELRYRDLYSALSPPTRQKVKRPPIPA